MLTHFDSGAITEVTRRGLFDELRLTGVSWSGRLGEADFVGRIFDLSQLPSRDHRVAGMAADIVMHRERFYDWPEDWIYDDSRLNLLRAPDEVFLRFLCEMVHPIVRSDDAEAAALVGTFNRHLAVDGFEIAPATYISGKPIYTGRLRFQSPQVVTGDARRVADALASDQVAAQITRMEASIETDPALAIGSAKEFLETLCKGILSAKGDTLTGSETLPQLVKRTRSLVDLDTDAQTGDTIKRTLSALATITQGIAELRGQLGSGHGHHPSAPRPDPIVARLAVGSAITLEITVTRAIIPKRTEMEAVGLPHARLPRIVLPGIPHHVTQRGNRREQVFFEDGDYELYLDLLSDAAARSGGGI